MRLVWRWSCWRSTKFALLPPLLLLVRRFARRLLGFVVMIVRVVTRCERRPSRDSLIQCALNEAWRFGREGGVRVKSDSRRCIYTTTPTTTPPVSQFIYCTYVCVCKTTNAAHWTCGMHATRYGHHPQSNLHVSVDVIAPFWLRANITINSCTFATNANTHLYAEAYAHIRFYRHTLQYLIV